MDTRTKLVRFHRKFRQFGLDFNEIDWAQCLLYMAKNIDSITEPIDPPIFQVVKDLGVTKEQLDKFNKVPEVVLMTENNDMKRRIKTMESQLLEKDHELRVLRNEIARLKDMNLLLECQNA